MKILFFIINFFIVVTCFGQKITVNGNWKLKLKATEIIEAGNDYKGTHLSKRNQSKITVTSHPKSKYFDLYGRYKVFVHKEDNEWHPQLKIQVKRTAKGISGNNNINSGLVFQTITNHSSFFLNTTGKHVKIPIQYRIKGISVLLPVKKYSTQIIFTVLNL